MNASRPDPGTIADARPTNWVDSRAPHVLRPYFKLARYDRPIGTWLLLLPCWFAQALAHLDVGDTWPNLWYGTLFAIGAIAMRGAGCTWNDIVDRNYDGRVARTALRPIPSGQVSVRQAVLFGVLQCLVGLVVLIQFNWFTIWLAIASLGLIAVYPFAKRYTYWPQVVLGLTFKWGALVGFAAVTGTLAPAAVLLYAGSVAWTIGYDTIYAHQDKEDDALLGLKSTALRFGDDTQRWLAGFYTAAILLWGAALTAVEASWISYAGLVLAAGHCVWQIATLDTEDAENCLRRFKSNRDLGLIFVAAMLVDMSV